MLISNLYDVPTLGLATSIGFAATIISLMMGVFLLKNELPVEYEGYRNATFMWCSALLLFIVSFDKYIDRMDAIFLLSLFAFYVLYIIYRTSKSKEYVYLKQIQFNTWIYPISIFAIVLSCWFLVVSIINLGYIFNVPLVKFGAIFLGFALAFPLFNIINAVFRSSRLTFDNLLGNVISCLTLVPGVAALINPIPLTLGGELSIMPFIVLNVITISFAMATRLTYSLHRKMGIFLIAAYVFYIVSILFF
jgi:cation:H+ antiporter